MPGTDSEKNEKRKKARDRGEPTTLHPVPFDEAVADLLKVKPEPPAKEKGRRKPKS
jgi:hypothetical protein